MRTENFPSRAFRTQQKNTPPSCPNSRGPKKIEVPEGKKSLFFGKESFFRLLIFLNFEDFSSNGLRWIVSSCLQSCLVQISPATQKNKEAHYEEFFLPLYQQIHSRREDHP